MTTTPKEYQTRLYKIWSGMKTRCNNPKSTGYHRYGGKGVRCNDWLNFDAFKNDMYASYLDHVKLNGLNTFLDRVDSNGNYSKKNCHWVTMKENNRNRKDNKIYTYRGVKGTLMELLEKFDKKHSMNPWTIRSRLNQSGWDIKKSLETPVQPRRWSVIREMKK